MVVKKLFNGNVGLILKVGGAILVATATAATAWTLTNVRVSANAENIKNQGEEIKEVCGRVRSVEDFRIEQRSHNKYTKDMLERIDRKLDK